MYKALLYLPVAVVHLLVSGCVGFSVPVPIDTPEEFTESKKSVRSLMGSDSSDVIKVLGEPTWSIPRGERFTDYVYQWESKDYWWSWLYFMPMPLVSSHGQVQPHCILLEFDNDRLQAVKVEKSHDPDNCLVVFYLAPTQPITLSMQEMKDPRVSRNLINGGNAESQFALYLHDKENTENIRNLCRLAEIGYIRAQKEIAHRYWLRDDIKDNRSRSYMWYTLAATAKPSATEYYDEPAQQSAMVEAQYKLKKVLTGEQLGIALQLLSQWKPGQCETDLVPANHLN